MTSATTVSHSSDNIKSSRNHPVMRQVIPRSHPRRSPDASFSSTASAGEDGYSLSAYGDHSMSEAYNVPAPTTRNYPLKLKRVRPPKAKKLAKEANLKLPPRDLTPRKEIQQLVVSTLDGPPLSPNSDFKRFMEGIKSTRAGSSKSEQTCGKGAM